MSLRTRLLVFGYPLLEVLAFWGVARLIGFGWATLLILLGFPVGWAMIRRAGDEATQGRGERAIGLGVAGVMIAIPGFLTDCVGVLLLLPPVRRALGDRMRTWMERSPIRMGFATGDVIPGEVVRRGLDQAERGSAP